MQDADSQPQDPSAEAATAAVHDAADWRAAAAHSVTFLDFECDMPVQVANALRALRAALSGDAVPNALQREIDAVRQAQKAAQARTGGPVNGAGTLSEYYLEGLLFAARCAPFVGAAERLQPADPVETE